MPRNSNPYRQLEGKPRIPPLPRQGATFSWELEATNAVRQWLDHNSAAINDIAARQPMCRTHTEGNELRLELFPDANGRPLFAYTRRPNGTLASHQRQDQPILHKWDDYRKRFQQQVAASLWAELTRRTPAQTASLLLFANPGGWDRSPQTMLPVTDAAYRATDAALRQVIANGISQQTDQSPTAFINDLLRRRFVKRQHMELARRCWAPPEHYQDHSADYDPGHAVTIGEYNFAIRHAAVLRPALERYRNAVLWLCQTQRNRLLRLPAGRLEPSDIVAAVRTDLCLTTKARWRAFLSLPAAETKAGTNPETGRATLRNTAHILALGNPDKHTPADRGLQRRSHIAEATAGIRDLLDADWAHGSTRARWAQICAAYLRHEGPVGRRTNDNPLRDLSDAFSATVNEDRPWPDSGDYADHRDKSERWHTARRQQRYAEQARQHRTLRWPSPVPAHTGDNGMHCQPLTDPQLLAVAGAQLNNYLATYYNRCVSGNLIAFAFSGQPYGRPLAAASLRRATQTDEWRIDQISDWRNSPAPDWARPWAEQIVAVANEPNMS